MERCILDRNEFNEFKNKYLTADAVLRKEEFYLELLKQTYDNKEDMEFIKRANDILEEAPIITWMKINWEKINNYEKHLDKEKRLDSKTQRAVRISLGAWWGYVYRFSEKYKGQYEVKERKRVNVKNVKNKNKKGYMFGIKMATVFIPKKGEKNEENN